MNVGTAVEPSTTDAIADAGLGALRELVGVTFRLRDHYEVGREKVREFARATRNDHPVHLDESAAAAHGYPGLLAPPTFVALLGGAAQAALAVRLGDCDLTSAVQTGQVLDYHRPVVVGDRLTSNISVHSVRAAFGGLLLDVSNKVTDRHGEPLITAHTSFIARPGAGPDLSALETTVLRHGVLTDPPPLADRMPPARTNPAAPEHHRPRGRKRTEVRPGDPLPPREYHLTLGDLVHYAGLSGDPNPIHWHEPATALVGLGPGVIAHGMLVMSLGAGYLSGWLGDPAAIRQYSVRLSSPVEIQPGTAASVEFNGRVVAAHHDTGTATLSLTATQNGRRIFGRATALVRLA